jgi:lactoylglutathione lyase/glyoxylase I family protein
MIELLGGGDPLPIDAPTYTDLGDSLRYAGYHHFCMSVADIEATVAELRKRGVAIVTEPFKLDDISRKLAFFADPFGNLIELAEVV